MNAFVNSRWIFDGKNEIVAHLWILLLFEIISIKIIKSKCAISNLIVWIAQTNHLLLIIIYKSLCRWDQTNTYSQAQWFGQFNKTGCFSIRIASILFTEWTLRHLSITSNAQYQSIPNKNEIDNIRHLDEWNHSLGWLNQIAYLAFG